MRNPYFLMGIQLILWGSYAAVSKLVLSEMSVWTFQCYSFGIAFTALGIPYLIKGGWARLRSVGLKQIGLLCAMAIPSFLYYFCYTTALSLTGAVEASVLNYTFPVFILLLAWPVCGERPTRRGLFTVLLGLAGAVIVLAGNGTGLDGFFNPGALCALLGAFFWGLFSNLERRTTVDGETANLIYMACGFVLSFAGMMLFSKPEPVQEKDILCLLWNGVFSLAAGYQIWFRILQITPAALAANLSFVTPFVNLLFISCILHEPIRLNHWLGLALILLAVVIQALPSATEKKP